RVRAADGGQAGCNGVSARTVLRLIDGILFYALGAFVARVTGRRRRRLGDWAGRTVVVLDDAAMPVHRRPALWQLAAYPVVWLVLAGLGASALAHELSERESAISLVRAYAAAREHGEAARACSLLTRGQQLELVAIQTGDTYGRASASECPRVILANDPRSHLLNPGLPALAGSSLGVARSPLGVLAVYSREEPGLTLVETREHGQLKLDIRGLERAEFVHSCASFGTVSSN